MILITGTTGLVGTHLIVELLKKNNPSNLRGIYRSEAKKTNTLKIIERIYGIHFLNLASAIDWKKGDITKINELENAFRDVTYVYHCAGLVSNDPTKRSLLRKINIEGTANVVNLALDKKVKKLCYVSSIATLGKGKNENISTEESYRENLNNSSHYSISKYGGEMEVWRASQEGLPVVIVNPGIILGEGFYLEGSGELFNQAKQNFPFKIEKITGFISVKDVVKIMTLLMEKDIYNKRYVLVSDNKKLSEIQTLIAEKMNCKLPKISLKKWMLYIYWLYEVLFFKVLGKRRKLSLDVIPTLIENRIYSNKKIKHELNYTFSPIEKTIVACCDDFKNLS